MFVWTTIFLAMALVAAPFALADIVRAPTAHAAFFVMAMFAALALLTGAVASARRISAHGQTGRRHH